MFSLTFFWKYFRIELDDSEREVDNHTYIYRLGGGRGGESERERGKREREGG